MVYSATRSWFVGSVALAAFVLPACVNDASSDATSGDSAQTTNGSGGPTLCAAVKGNGPRILAQVAALARVTEEFGPKGTGQIDAMAGGSSASISEFLYGSILLNPAVGQCGTPVSPKACSPLERANRIALLLKSVHGYGAIAAEEVNVKEVVADIQKSQQVDSKVSPVDRVRIAGELRGTLEKAAGLKDFGFSVSIINTRDLLPLVRPDNPDLDANVAEIQRAVQQFGKFEAPDTRVFFRVPLIDWAAASRIFGRAADFYAGPDYGSRDVGGFAKFLNECAGPSRGKTWAEASVTASSGGTCGAQFKALLSNYLGSVGRTPTKRHRLNDSIGADGFRALAHSTAIIGSTAASFKSTSAAYKAGTGDAPGFSTAFSDVLYGYWSSAADASLIKGDPSGDLKAQKLAAFGEKTWEHILSRSPAEPGIARAVETQIPGQALAYTTGGWGDGLPTQVLEKLGCQNTILVTRPDVATAAKPDFQRQLAKRLGATDGQVGALYDQKPPTGVPFTSISKAGAVWCANWDGPQLSKQDELENEGYSAKLLVSKPFFNGSYTPSKDNIAGCTPGVEPKP